MMANKIILSVCLFIFIIIFPLKTYTFSELPLNFNFKVNKSNYDDIIKFLKEKNYIFTITKRNFYPLSRIITVKTDNSSKIKLIKLVFDNDKILKTKVYFINYKLLQKYINYFKNRYKVIKYLKNPVERVRLFMLFDINSEKAGIIEFRKGKSFFSLRIVDKKFFGEVLNNLKKELEKVLNKIYSIYKPD